MATVGVKGLKWRLHWHACMSFTTLFNVCYLLLLSSPAQRRLRLYLWSSFKPSDSVCLKFLWFSATVWIIQYIACVAACAFGYYGDGCHSNCRCAAGRPCDHVTGQCQCPAGKTGLRCFKRQYNILWFYIFTLIHNYLLKLISECIIQVDRLRSENRKINYPFSWPNGMIKWPLTMNYA